MSSLPNHITTPVTEQPYDVAIIGGGLAGLSMAILLGKEGHRVILFEKEHYPFHKVCGEYISLESWNFLEGLGYPLSDMDLPVIEQLLVSAPNGNFIKHTLPLGGFGISRYKIDAALAQLARSCGVTIVEGAKINEVVFNSEQFTVRGNGIDIRAIVVTGSFGKRSNLDVKWKRHFVLTRPNKLNNYIGVKYHIQTDHPADTIALHNFSDGYCGISKIEDDCYCLCYLTTAQNLQRAGGSIAELERNVLHKNPFLQSIFTTARFTSKEPVTIAQISFEKKSQVEDHVLLTGDAAGMITPLCGNGMSMAMHGATIASGLITRFLQQRISRREMEDLYTKQWNTAFKKRLRPGRFIQGLFGKGWGTNIFIKIIKPFPKFITYLIRQTHGEPF
jgi:flavin-dependent dehydrogenase